MAIFEPGQVYRRRDLHAQYGGQGQGGISTPKAHPFVMLITGATGQQYGYQDGFQPDGTFWYTGEGQVGDMQMVKGNRAIRDHHANGKTLYLFEDLDDGRVQYIGEATCIGWHERLAPDRNGHQRTAIVFELALDGAAEGTPHPDLRTTVRQPADERRLWKRPLQELRQQALTRTSGDATAKERRANVYSRSQAVRVYVLRGVAGTCEACGATAPFVTVAGRPYLEPHHIRRRADGGPDHPRWVAGGCPNCHRRAHFAADGDQFNEELATKVGAMEASDGV